MNMIACLAIALKTYKKDKWIVLFSLAPILIGGMIYFFVGNYIYGDLMSMGEEWIKNSIDSSGWGSFLYYIMAGILTIGFYFLLSWTFVLVISGISSPFNDIISRRVERVLIGELPEEVAESFKRMSFRFVGTILNELKKIGFIFFLSLFAFAVSFLPILAPIGIMVSAILMAVSFLDYTWSRKEMPFRDCIRDIRKNFLSYGIMGGAFLVLISIPFLNLFLLPFGVIYFTVLYTEKNTDKKRIFRERVTTIK